VLVDYSQGGAFLHNLFAGNVVCQPEDRHTPYHKEHSTEIAGLSDINGGDNRFHNNIFVGGQGTQIYDDAKLPMQVDGNVYLNGASAYQGETNCVYLPQFDPSIRLVEEQEHVHLHLTLPQAGADQRNRFVTTELLGRARIPDAPYENFDGTLLNIDCDYFGARRNQENPSTGPFENPGAGKLILKVWPARR
jgi:hypothetical protein